MPAIHVLCRCPLEDLDDGATHCNTAQDWQDPQDDALPSMITSDDIRIRPIAYLKAQRGAGPAVKLQTSLTYASSGMDC